MMTRVRHLSLFTQSATLFIALVMTLQVLTIAAYFLLVGKPLVRASVLDFSALIALSAETWASLPAAARPALIESVRAQHRLDMAPAAGELSGETSLLPYVTMLETALSERARQRVRVRICADTPDCYVTDLPTAHGPLRFRFNRERFSTNPLSAMLIGFAFSVVIAVGGAWYLARFLSRPLTRLAEATGKLSQGDMSIQLSEDGPRELARLAEDFNRMTQRLRELINNRAIVLAGVSHDLRTPIARLRMALEMARREADPALWTQMERYLEDMNQLIGQFLDYSRGVRTAPATELDATAHLRELVAALSSELITVRAPEPCHVKLPVVPFTRVLQNILQNALRYGGGQAVAVSLEKISHVLQIEVKDGGPGIPATARAEIFKPFVQLDAPAADLSGAGLGLAIVHQICNTYGWQVKILSRKGGGTVVRLTIALEK